MKNPHAVFTKDEKIWKDFEGPVPRKGEEIRFISDDCKYRVKNVFWFIASSKTEDLTGECRYISQARIVIEPKPNQEG